VGFCVVCVSTVRRDVLVNQELILSRLAMVHHRLNPMPVASTGAQVSHQEDDDVEQEEQLHVSFAERAQSKAAAKWNSLILQAHQLIDDQIQAAK